MFEPGTLSHKVGLALLTSGLLAGTLSSAYASFKAFNTPDADLSQYLLGWILGAVGVLLLGFAAFFGNSLFQAIGKGMKERRAGRV